ncbi:peptidoglycan recognition protein 3-like isoform X5 [Onthophagus taurus]|uniref:peptidoglycan recognition protein 3-like isoform X5 n=1 Tax=Onthophagus taurus TaxID=166361 RepID=UPI0039BEAC6F
MVSDVVHLDTTISQRIKHGDEEREDEDTISVSTASTDNCDGAVVLHDAEDKAPCFQNIEVTNSSDVHFGNKTYYQGPVTIKQILYTNRDGENKLPETNDIYHEQPQLAINEKVEGGLNYASYNDGYTTDGVHHINGHGKLPNGINHDHFETIRGSGEKKLSNNQWLLVGGAIFAVILLIITAVALALSLKGSSSSVSQILVDDDGSTLEYMASHSRGLRMLSRSDWGAVPHKGDYTLLKKPIPYVIIHHTATERCFNRTTCKAQAFNIQNRPMESFKVDDVGYSFMIGGDGYVYEGTGWNYWGAHAKGYNNVSIGIAFIGTFTKFLPDANQLEQAQLLIEDGIKRGLLCKEYRLIGINQVSTFESPGKSLIKEIKTWDHFFDFTTADSKSNNSCMSLQTNLTIISRKEWGARTNRGTYIPLKLPVPYVIIHHTATERCFDKDTCYLQAISIQDYHMDNRKWADIAYSFMIGGDGNVYDARGWDNMGAHTLGYNNVSIGIAFIGTFTKIFPEPFQLIQAHLLIAEGVQKRYIDKDYKLVGMNQVRPFESPGQLLIQEIKTWPHFYDFKTDSNNLSTPSDWQIQKCSVGLFTPTEHC